jgi:type IV pilus assembly protein PilC
VNNMRFKIKAIKNSGERYEAVLESQSKYSLYNELKAEGNMLINAEEIGKFGPKDVFYKIFPFLGGVSTSQKIFFSKNLSAMTKAGLSLSRSLAVIARQSTGRLKNVVEGINLEIKKGKTLSEALKNYPNVFSRLFVSMAKAGEESGKLSESLDSVALQMDKTYRLQKKIRGAMIYPAVIIAVMITVGVLMFIFVVPGLTTTFKELKTDLPASTKFIIALSDFFANHWLLAILVILSLIFGFIFSLRTVFGKRFWDAVTIKLPLIGDLVRESNAAKMSRTLSSLLMAGVPVAQSILITKEIIGNYYYQQVLDEAAKMVEKGESVSAVFMKNSDLYPTFVGEMMEVGEETGNLSSMLSEVATFYENDVEERTKDISAIIEPVLMVVIGVAVGFFAISMVAPIYSVMDNI